MVPSPPPKNPNYLSTYHICFLVVLVSTTTLCAAVPTSSYSSACPSVAPASDRHTDADADADEALSLARSFQVYDGHFSGGGADSLFSPDDQLQNSYRSFSLFPDRATRTSDPALVHLTATLTLTGPRSSKYLSHGRRRNHTFAQSISFVLDGYYSSASLQLCMVGTGAEPVANGSSPKQYADVKLRLHVPSPSSLADPFVTGTLDGSSDFGAIQLLAYAEGDDYKYGERATCNSPPAQPATGSLRALEDNFACELLRETSYRLLDHHGGGAPAKPRRMHVNRMQCGADGIVRAYMVLSNDTGSGRRGYRQRHLYHHMVSEEAVVADGHWDSARRMLCLRACRVARSVTTSTLAVRECGIAMSLWFPAAWTVLERSVVAGVLWNSGAGPISRVVSAFSFGDHRRNLSDVTYNYNDTMLEPAKRQYLKKISKEKKKKKIEGSFPVPRRSSYHDFRLQFYMARAGSGDAYPVSIGSVMLDEDGGLAADSSSSSSSSSSSRPAVADDLLCVSYDIHHYAPDPAENRANASRSNILEEGRISAEGVYDPKRGILSMAGCQERDDGSTDCQILVTVQFASLGDRAEGIGSRGAISSLRDRTDRLFFEEMGITLYGTYSVSVELSAAVSRMDLESVMLVVSATLSCVFAVTQILHARKNPEAAPAMSVTMLAVLALGHLAPLALGFEVLFLSRRSPYSLYSTTDEDGWWLELNQAMMRAPALLAFVLQLRLLQLALLERLRPSLSPAGHRSEPAAATPPTAVSERAVLRVCLPLYLLGAILAATVHVINARAAAANQDWLAGRVVGGNPATLWDDLVSCAGLVVDGFLLPQVILNASVSGSRAPAISPWFYVGGTVIRAAPHLYDVAGRRVFEESSLRLSYVYASPRGDLYGVAWDVVVPCGAALLASLLFLQQRRLGDASSLRRRSGGYEMVSRA